jgi:hypothetical protein
MEQLGELCRYQYPMYTSSREDEKSLSQLILNKMEHPGSILRLPAGPADFTGVPEVDTSTGQQGFVVNTDIEDCFSRAKVEALGILRRRIEEKGLEAVTDILEGEFVFVEVSGSD